jgi:hypothetical protein
MADPERQIDADLTAPHAHRDTFRGYFEMASARKLGRTASGCLDCIVTHLLTMVARDLKSP